MNLLLDTNVLSEVRRPAPDPTVLAWLDTVDEDRTFISVVSIAEIRRGVALMEESRRRDALAEWLGRDLLQRFERRILPVNEAVALAWGDLMGIARRRGRGLSSMDGWIAATALAAELTLATRNTKDFAASPIEAIDANSFYINVASTRRAKIDLTAGTIEAASFSFSDTAIALPVIGPTHTTATATYIMILNGITGRWTPIIKVDSSGVFTTTALTKLRPSADTSAGSWSASSGSVLYTMIDESVADDADYITTSSNTVTKIKLETATDPGDNSNHALRIRARSTSGTLTVRLVEGDPTETTIVSWVPTLSASFADHDYNLTTAEASVITDYSALYVKFTTS